MVPISPEIFSSEAVIFDNRSLFDYQQKLAERRAKREAAEQEALDGYLKELAKTPDPFGMRKGDIPLFKQKLDGFRALSNEFRKSPQDLDKKLKLQQSADELKTFVARSKEAKEVGKRYNDFIAQLAMNPEKRKSTDLEKLVLDKEMHDLPLDFNVPMLGIVREDKEFDPNYYIPPPVNTYDLFEKNSKGINLGPAVRISQTDKDFNYVQESRYTPEGIETIALRIADRVENDPDLASSYKTKGAKYSDDELANFKAMLQKYPKLKDIDVDDANPVSIAIAEAVEEGEKRKQQKKVVDTRARTAYQKSFGGGGTPPIPKIKGNALDEIGSIKPINIDGGVQVVNGVATDATGKPVTGELSFKYDDMPANLVLVLGEKILEPTGRKKDIIVKYENGKAVSIQQSGKSIASRQTVENAQLKYNTESTRGEQPEFGPKEKKENSYLIKGKTYSEKQLIEMGYTLDQIKPYLKK